MPKLRALVVDDAVVMRRLLTEALHRDPRIEVVATAPNGRIALQKIGQVNPDVVTLDLEMPDLDGLATLRELRRTHPRLPVIIFSALTQRGALATLDALAAGASDYVTKPAEMADLAQTIARLEAELLPRIHAHCRTAGTPPAAPTTTTPARSRAAQRAPVELVCLGTSTGGPNALAEVFQGITAPLPVPVAIVQHMPPMFTRFLAERLNALPGALRCVEAADGQVLEPGCAYLAPGGIHLGLERTAGRLVARLLDLPPENSCRPAVDVLLRSAAPLASILAVVMTGMGQDGLRGCEHVLEHRGQVFVQDAATSVVWGMPGSVAQAGLADSVLPLAGIAREISRRVLAGQPASA